MTSDWTRWAASVLVVALLAGGAAGVDGSVATRTSGATVEDVSYGADPVVPASGTLYIWQSDEHEFTVRITSEEAVSEAAVCLLANETGNDPRELACRNVSLAAGGDRTVTISLAEWPADLLGPRTLAAVVRNQGTDQRIASGVQSVVVIERDADLDGDGLSNEREVQEGTNLTRPDTDGDGLGDASEVETYETSPTDADTDSDGLSDGQEVDEYHVDPTNGDTDGDGLSDGREVELGTAPTRADSDGDGIEDGSEVDRYQTNATLADTDGDGLADGAEVDEYGTNPTVSDTDGDGLADGVEVHVHDTDPTVTDTDGDGPSDDAEVREYLTDPAATDTDGDGLADGDELNDYGTDPLAADTDGDGLVDGREVTLGSNPTDPTSTADPGLPRRLLWLATDNPLAAGGLAAVALVALGSALAVRFGDRLAVGPVARLLSRDDETEATATPDGVTAEQTTVDPDEGAGDGGTGADVDAATRVDPESEATPDANEATDLTTDLQIMTNEERVQHLLEEHGGRMLQSDIVEAADWSKATVSRVLSRMEEDGAVSRVDIGKGNLVTRPEDEPASADSPFSE